MKISFNAQFNNKQKCSFAGVSNIAFNSIVSNMQGSIVARNVKILDRKMNNFFDAILTRDFVGGANNECYFYLYTKDKKQLGTITVMDTHPTLYEQNNNIPNMLEYYKDRKMRHKILELDYIGNDNRADYKNIGTQFINVAIQESINRGFHGHVVLRSVKLENTRGVVHDVSIPFFYKLGFRSNPKTNTKIESILNDGSDINQLNNIPFYLPDEKRLEFLQKLDTIPAFESTFFTW